MAFRRRDLNGMAEAEGPSAISQKATTPVGTGACPLCSSLGNPWFASRGRHVRRCNACGFIWVAEGLSRDANGQSIYETEKPIFFEDGNEEYYLGPTSFTNARIKLDLVKRAAPPPARLLDIGAGFGHFVKLACKEYAACGLEISPAAAAWGRRELGVNIITGGLDCSASELTQPFDVVTLWDVIEHLEDPRSALQAIKDRLKPQGHLILSTPDAGSFAARMLGRGWYYLDPIQHISVFSRRNLSKLLADTGFEVGPIETMGHSYQIGYMLSRLDYFYHKGLAGGMIRLAKPALGPFRERHLYINPHDVLALVAMNQGSKEPESRRMVPSSRS